MDLLDIMEDRLTHSDFECQASQLEKEVAERDLPDISVEITIAQIAQDIFGQEAPCPKDEIARALAELSGEYQAATKR